MSIEVKITKEQSGNARVTIETLDDETQAFENFKALCVIRSSVLRTGGWQHGDVTLNDTGEMLPSIDYLLLACQTYMTKDEIKASSFWKATFGGDNEQYWMGTLS